jgi:hypothetical protein
LSSSKWVPHKASLKRPKEMEVRRSQIWAVGWMEQHSPTHLGDVFPDSQACVRHALSCWSNISQ